LFCFVYTWCILPFDWLTSVRVEHPKVPIITSRQALFTRRNHMIANDIATMDIWRVNTISFTRLLFPLPFHTSDISNTALTCSSWIILIHQMYPGKHIKSEFYNWCRSWKCMNYLQRRRCIRTVQLDLHISQ
jgi:hypothetical protein